MIAKGIIVAASCALFCGLAESRADSPMSPPERIERQSSSGRFLAISDPAKSRVDVFARCDKGSPSQLLWTFPEYFGHFYLVDNGPTIVVEWAGMNLLPLDASDDLVVVRFIRNGRIVQKYALGDLVARRDLKRTISHYRWRREFLVDDASRLFINTESGERWFDISTGKLIPRPQESSLFKH